MLFKTERLYVRKLQDGDLEALHILYSDPAIMEYIRAPLKVEETKKIFDEQLVQYTLEPQLGRYMIVNNVSNSFVGLFMLRKKAEKEGVEIGYSFRKQDWGKGYATEIVKNGIEYAFANLPFESIYAITHPKNENSKKVLVKCGFVYQCDINEDGKQANLFSIQKNKF